MPVIGEELTIPFTVGEEGEGEKGGGGKEPGKERGHGGNPFSYIARDLLSWSPLDVLPYQGVRFGRILNQHGAWLGQLPLADQRVQQLDWKDSTKPSRTALFVDLQGTLVWGGIIWTRNYESDDPSHSLKVGAVEFGSYFQHRLQAADYGTLWEKGEDPMKVARRIVEDAKVKEAEGPGHIAAGITIVLRPSAGSGQSIPVSYPGTSLQTVDSIVSTLSQMGYGAGFDYSFDVAYLPGTKTPAVTLNLDYPLRGRTAEETGIVILGKEATKWTYPEDGGQQATELVETGSGTGLLPATVTASLPGFPLLQKAISRTQITTQELLDKIALGDMAIFEFPVITPSITLPVPLPETPAAERKGLALGEFDTGDRFIFKVDPVEGGSENNSPRFPEGMTAEWRCNAWNVTPADTGLSTLQIDASPPPLGYIPQPEPPS